LSFLFKIEQLVTGWSQPANRPLDLVVMAGEVVGLTGANGVGKSTLLAALTGRARIFSGTMQTRDGLRIALQTQDIPPVDGLPLSGRELLGLTGASEQGLPPWLAERIYLRLDQLSGGQRHYLSLWAILHAPADLVLLDEPTNNLDAAGVAHLVAHLRERAAMGASVLVVSHDQAFVKVVCDRIVVMEAHDVE
jgi:ATPase subunit of ABC transporter with duplicated ATPase domains